MSRARRAVTAVVVVALTWGQTGALSMVLNFSVRRTIRSSQYSIVDVLRHSQQRPPQSQSPLSLRREVIPVACSRVRGRGAWTMATTSSTSAVFLKDCSERSHRLVRKNKLHRYKAWCPTTTDAHGPNTASTINTIIRVLLSSGGNLWQM